MFPFAGTDERDLAAGVAAFAGDLRDRIPAAENEGTIPADVIRSLGSLGVLGMNVPEPDGGLGASAGALALRLPGLPGASPRLGLPRAGENRLPSASIPRLGTAGPEPAIVP